MYTKIYRDVATIDIPNFFILTLIDRKPGEEKVIINVKGLLVDMLVYMDLEKHGPNVVYEKLNKVLYLEFLKTIYVMLKSSILS